MTICRSNNADVVIFNVGAEQTAFSLDRHLINRHFKGSAHDDSRTEKWLFSFQWAFRLEHTTPRAFSRFCQFIYHGDYSPPPPTIRMLMGNHSRRDSVRSQPRADRESSSGGLPCRSSSASSSRDPSGRTVQYEELRYERVERLDRDGPEYQESLVRAKEERLRCIKEDGYPGYARVEFRGIGSYDLRRELEAVVAFEGPLGAAPGRFTHICPGQAEDRGGKSSAIRIAFEDMRCHRQTSGRSLDAEGQTESYRRSDYLAPVLILHVELYGLARYACLDSLAGLCLDKIHTTLLAIDFSAEFMQDLFEVIMYMHAPRGSRERYLSVLQDDQDPLNSLLARYMAWKVVDAGLATDRSFLELLAGNPGFMREFWRQILAWRIEQ